MPVTHAKSNIVGDWAGTVTVGNSSGGTTTMLASDLVRPSDWNSGHVVNLSASEIASLFKFGTGLTSSTAAGGISVGNNTEQFFEPFLLHNTNSTLSAPGIGTWYFDGPYYFPQGLGPGQIRWPVAAAAGFSNGGVFSAATTGSISKYQTVYHHLAFYRPDTGANTTRLTLAWSNSYGLICTDNYAVSSTASDQVNATHAVTISIPSQFDTAGGVTYGTTSQSTSSSTQQTTMASSAINAVSTVNSYVSGSRMDMMPFNTTLTPDVYWLAHMYTSTSSTAGTAYTTGTIFSTQSRLGVLENLVNAFKPIGSSVSNSTTNVQPFHGFLATTTSLATNIVDVADIRGTTGRVYWNFAQSTY